MELGGYKMRALVAGGAGFLGSHLCERLLTEGFDVICVDTFITGRRENIAHLLGHPRFLFLLHDITEPLHIDKKLDYVLHLASPASPKDYLRLPIETLRTGALGTYYLLELARMKRATFLLASSSEVYGDPEVHPQPESYWGRVNPVGPRSVYDEAKRYSEALTMAYHRQYELDVRIARIFNTYGPRMRPDDGRVVSNFCWQALQQKPLTIYGEGSQTRSFCYVSDMVEGLYLLVHARETRPINLGNPDEISVLTLLVATVRSSSSRFLLMILRCVGLTSA
jgi:dTDP-glucose 4,6-dehydratase